MCSSQICTVTAFNGAQNGIHGCSVLFPDPYDSDWLWVLSYTSSQCSYCYASWSSCGLPFYPLLGWLADVYFTRYRLILFSFITMIVASVISITIASLSVIYVDSTVVNKASFIVSGLCLIVGVIAVGLFVCRTSCRNAVNIPGSYALTHRHNWRSGV